MPIPTGFDLEPVIKDELRKFEHLVGPRREGKSKQGERIKDALLQRLRAEFGIFDVQRDDPGKLLPDGAPVWRYSDTRLVVPTSRRRIIDIVVSQWIPEHRRAHPKALIEVESDLEDLWNPTRGGLNNYAVRSIARDGSGQFFDSYQSLERMAVAAQYAAKLVAGQDITYRATDTDQLEQIQSDGPEEHNPLGLAMYLVTGWRWERDYQRLERRLRSLAAKLLEARVEP